MLPYVFNKLLFASFDNIVVSTNKSHFFNTTSELVQLLDVNIKYFDHYISISKIPPITDLNISHSDKGVYKSTIISIYELGANAI